MHPSDSGGTAGGPRTGDARDEGWTTGRTIECGDAPAGSEPGSGDTVAMAALAGRTNGFDVPERPGPAPVGRRPRGDPRSADDGQPSPSCSGRPWMTTRRSGGPTCHPGRPRGNVAVSTVIAQHRRHPWGAVSRPSGAASRHPGWLETGWSHRKRNLVRGSSHRLILDPGQRERGFRKDRVKESGSTAWWRQ
jgi:hypothetical protein